MLLLLVPSAWADEDQDTDESSDDESPGEVLVVTGTRTERSLSDSIVTTDVVTREQIEASGASDASEVLETLPGVQVTRSFRGAGVRMQGLDPRYTLVLVDGERVIGQTDGVVDLARIPAERIERIEIVKGAASALYGSDAVGGVINIITRQPRAPLESQTVLSYGSRNTADASEALAAAREKWDAGLELGYHRTDGYDWDPGDLQTDGNAVEEASVGGRAGVDVSPDLELALDGSYRIQDSRGVDQTGSATFDRQNLTEDASARIGGTHRSATAKTQLHAGGSLYRDQYALDQRDADDLDQYEDARETLAQLDAQRDQVWGRQLLSLGAEAAQATLVSPRLSEDGLRYRGAVFAQDEWRVTDAVTLVPSARVDVDSWFGTHPTPRLAARWDVNEALALRVNAGLGFRAPTFEEMFLSFSNPSAGYQVAGNPDLEPETSVGVTAGAECAASSRVQLRLDGFYTELHDLITIEFVQEGTASTPSEYSYVNVASAWTTGGEADLRMRLGSVLHADLGYTYTATWDRVLEHPLDGRAPHRGTFGITARWASALAEATLRGEVVGPTTFFLDEDGDGTEDEVVADPYVNAKVRLEKTILPHLTRPADGPMGLRIFVGVDNVLDAGDALYVHLDPRLFYAGVTLDLPNTP
jgi:outer membrane receptor for ferrienterochelin and colicins